MLCVVAFLFLAGCGGHTDRTFTDTGPAGRYTGAVFSYLQGGAEPPVSSRYSRMGQDRAAYLAHLLTLGWPVRDVRIDGGRDLGWVVVFRLRFSAPGGDYDRRVRLVREGGVWTDVGA